MPKPTSMPVEREIPIRVDGARQSIDAIEKILEVRPVFLETGRVDIRHVIGDHVELGLEGFHAGGGSVKGLNAHEMFLFR